MTELEYPRLLGLCPAGSSQQQCGRHQYGGTKFSEHHRYLC
jgi:hypothetical protein